jgi:hypothetical protein
MKTVYFNVHDGLVFSEDSIAGEEALSRGRALKALAPDNIESWRLSYDVVTRVVNVYGGVEKTNEQAAAQQTAEASARAIVEKDAGNLLMKNNEKTEALAKEARKQLLITKLAENPNIVDLLARTRPQ